MESNCRMRLLWLFGIMLLGGCATRVTTLDGRVLGIRSAAFRDYARAVFRKQNRLATELEFAIEDHRDDGAAERRFLALEEDLLRACTGLNELAVARRDNRRIGAFRAAKAARETPDCEAAAAAAEDALRLNSGAGD
jgi:hypothetical protein